ncbi:hypothetical protein [Sporosalibacterium faouarense]|uniref:hypothetical protein n=1 Tax=Sporosalibacterium faouarense TaxID=516123 RepID=UPI00192C34F1|nr:hypothetical protein [Sporosalibacterium faouarense]
MKSLFERIDRIMTKQIIKPSKGVSRFTFLIGVGFSIFGVIFIISSLFTQMTMILLPFGVIWTSIAIFNTYRSYKNGFTEEGISIYEIDSNDEEEGSLDFEEKLRKIEKLKKEGLISDSEYSKKRKEVLKDKW